MTDNEIVNALEHCSSSDLGECRDCPFYEQCENDELLETYALDLINRQKAEIERLTAERDVLKGWERLLKAEAHAPIIKKAKSEAIKEFAERLKERKYVSSDWSHGEHPFVVEEVDIDEVLDEMMEENDEL